jgi:Putative zinc-finger
MTEDVHLPLGAYVLGGLTAAERRGFEGHLDGCSSCRTELAELMPVAALLGRVAALPSGSDAAASEPALETLLSNVRARRRRTRITRWVATAAAVCLVAGAGAVVLDHQRTPAVTPAVTAAGPTLAMTAGQGLTTAAQISITHKAWGTAISLHADDLPTTGTFTLQAIADDGTVEPAATWGATTTGKATVDGATSIQAEDLGQIRILGPDHAVIASVPM